MDIGINSVPDLNEIVSASLGSAIDSAAISALMKKYAKFLMKKGIATDKEIIKGKIGEILSPALDRGVISQAVISNVVNWIDTECVGPLQHGARCETKFICKALCEDLPTFSANDMPEIIQRAAALKQELDNICSQLSNTYGSNIKSSVQKFISEFGKGMEPEFVQMCSGN